ncbi:DUF1559 family PulG-like putative transporter [Frigoriglobus tundricola]|uniref:DUF1559 domain-containing protein n=1 Tax=Frigoriglobus tundricola TaxID=2774151 RepID=A0A6M5Z187_9BACT|nr:DUF1559 domain-containing protein [Frigoriglobus tundricola]QJW99516.1 hypothetical protein FTUN_7128 [Frigoriglobus tundricola]
MRALLVSLVVPLALLSAAAAAPVPKADPLPPATEAQLKASRDNLERITLACINYADANNGQMATNTADKDGNPLLSWRVAILPYVEQANLYKQFKRDEPWDSDHNKKLVEKMPKLYAPVRVQARAGETFYQVFAGPGALFGPKQPLFPTSIPDGTSNTGLVFEAGDPVPWSKPSDLPFNEKIPLPKLGGLFDGELHVGMCDGSVFRVKKDFDAGEMKKLIMPADGNVLDIDKLRK